MKLFQVMRGVVLTMTTNYKFKHKVTELLPALQQCNKNLDLLQIFVAASINMNGCCTFSHNLRRTEMRKRTLFIALHPDLNK